MNAGFEQRLQVIWLTLCAVTIVSLVVGSLDGGVGHGANVLVTSTAVAVVKRVIFREFMEVRHAPGRMKAGGGTARGAPR